MTFPSTGRTLAESITFQKGFGTISGRNGAGKSSALEFLRWLLFGSAALRGKGEDYKTLQGKLTFSVRDVDYTIERTRTTAVLSSGDEALASGTTAVNLKIAQLLGFGLTVFDVACVANQGDLERLGSMKPTERKQMVDSVIGMSVIEDMARRAGTEASALRRDAKMLEKDLRKPEAPQKPYGYQPAARLADVIRQKEEVLAEIQRLSGQPNPGKRPTDLTHEEIEQRIRVQDAMLEISSMPPKARYTEKELQEIEIQIDIYDQFRQTRRLTQPGHSRADLLQWQEDYKIIEIHDQRGVLERQIATLKRAEITCPACRHSWTTDDARLRDLQTRLAELPEPPAVKNPPLSEHQLARMLQEWDDYEAQPKIEEVPNPPLDRSELAQERYRLTFMERREMLEDNIGPLPAMDSTNYSRLLVQLQVWEQQQKDYYKSLARVSELKPQIEDLEAIRALHREVLVYDALMKKHDADMEHYEAVLKNIAALEDQAAAWTAAQTALTAVRLRVKQHLLPSLNRVASYYISKMTGGEKAQVQIDDSFDVLVDNQPLNTLSGSEKAVANLAMRIGLGQVLTNNVLSVFIGDEIDASMDSERAENTSQTLWALKDNISQILLVTHKSPDADYYISVGNPNGLHKSHSGRAEG